MDQISDQILPFKIKIIEYPKFFFHSMSKSLIRNGGKMRSTYPVIEEENMEMWNYGISMKWRANSLHFCVQTPNQIKQGRAGLS